jgi:hypothetical protein
MTYPDDEEDVEEQYEDWDHPDPSDQDQNDVPEEIPCPYCGKPVSELAELCPHCQSYISREDAPRKLPPMWKIVIVGALVLFFTGLLGFWRGWFS